MVEAVLPVTGARSGHGVKEKKSIRWMPWRFEARKDVVNCEKPWGVVNRLRARDVRMGEPACRHGQACMSEASRAWRRTRGTEPSQYPEEEKSREIPGVAASERGRAQTVTMEKLVGVVVGGLWGTSGGCYDSHGPALQLRGSVLERRTREGESPVGEGGSGGCEVFPSTTGHEEPCGKLGGPPSKAKYSKATDSEPVP